MFYILYEMLVIIELGVNILYEELKDYVVCKDNIFYKISFLIFDRICLFC